MNKLIKIFILWGLPLVYSCSYNLYADEVNLCDDSGTMFAYFNGVLTSDDEADIALQEFVTAIGSQDGQGGLIGYEALYNHTHGLKDFVEVFEQRLEEQDGILKGRLELFKSAMKGEGNWWDILNETIPATAGLLESFKDTIRAQVPAKIASLFDSPPTMADYEAHQARIENWHNEGKKLLFVAHSQGNLFANNAYNYAMSKGRTIATTKVVHIAPASPQTNGAHVLADDDKVINALRNTGSVPPSTDSIPSFLLRKPGLNRKRDFLGHGLLEIYLNPHLTTSAAIKSHIRDALDTLEKPSNQKFDSGFLTATLTWNGSGDVDLHAYEPSGSHVYYANRRGVNGILDVDNTSSYGPEHYVISCEKSSITTGVYSIKIANYSRADGRVATVQLATAQDGVLDTKEIPLGSPTGSNPVYEAFQVEVSQDPETQIYSTNLIN